MQLLCTVKKEKLRKSLLADLGVDDQLFDALQEVALNTVKGRIPLSKVQRAKIKCKKAIHCLACPNKSILKSSRKKVKLVQQLGGGFWAFIIPTLISMLAEKMV